MLPTTNAGTGQHGIAHRLQTGARAFHVNTWVLCDKMVSMAFHPECFDAMLTPAVCFAAGHRIFFTLPSMI